MVSAVPAVRRPANPWLVFPRVENKSAALLFCFHFAGGNAGQYRSWSAAAPDDVEIVAVQLPGRSMRHREPLMRDVWQAVDALGPVLAAELALDPDRPFAFFGHSLGALVAFELARWLRRHQHPLPRHLHVVSRSAPHLPLRYPMVHELPEAALLDALASYGGVDDSMMENRDFARFFLPVIRADLEMNCVYSCQDEPPLDCPITAVCGDSDPICDIDQIQAWGAQTTQAFACDIVSGGHFFFQAQPQAYFPRVFGAGAAHALHASA